MNDKIEYIKQKLQAAPNLKRVERETGVKYCNIYYYAKASKKTPTHIKNQEAFNALYEWAKKQDRKRGKKT
jgi:hypothetical protein